MTCDRNFPHVTATYRPHPIPRYSSNEFISALPPFPNREDLRRCLTSLPTYNESERDLEASTRIFLLKQLSRFMLGLPRVAELAQSVQAGLIEGYVGREPHSPKVNQSLQHLYESTDLGKVRNYGIKNTAQFTSALLGSPGSGKSFSFARIASLYPPIIHHPKLNVWQIPVLQIEMAYNGTSVGTLAHAILSEIDNRFPDGNYRRLYLDARGNAEQKLLAALSLTQVHAVGLLHIDEAQNQRHSVNQTIPGEKRVTAYRCVGQTPLTTLLITASNRLQLPLVLSGTAELRDVFGKRMSLLRRMVGSGLRPWGPLSTEAKDGTLSEFDLFLAILWRFQWTKSKSPLTRSMRNLVHFYTFGIPDVIVKLYHDLQWRAIQRGGDEFIDKELLHDVASHELAALTQVTAALRKRDTASLARLSSMSDLAAEYDIRPGELNFLGQRLTAVPSELDNAGFSGCVREPSAEIEAFADETAADSTEQGSSTPADSGENQQAPNKNELPTAPDGLEPVAFDRLFQKE